MFQQAPARQSTILLVPFIPMPSPGRIGRSAACAIVALTILPCAVWAQTAPRPPYLDQRSDEDWRFLSDPSRRQDPWDSWKFISFGESAPNSYISIGGAKPLRWEFFPHSP